MKILVFEYITGGGMADQPLPASLRHEGALMLQTLVAELAELDDIDILVSLDYRCQDLIKDLAIKQLIIPAGQVLADFLPGLIAQVDAVWPIAPESEQCLFNIAGLIRHQHKLALISESIALSKCSDKLLTYQCLLEHQLATVSTQLLSEPLSNGVQVIKPRDGCGCQTTYVINGADGLPPLDHSQNYIIQPYVSGINASLSALFKNGQAWLICVNQQIIAQTDASFSLTACVVNSPTVKTQDYQVLVQATATAIPGLWGYIGIDIIETDTETLILEINPRLTSSYVGIAAATGLNIAEQVLALVKGIPNVEKQFSKTVRVGLG